MPELPREDALRGLYRGSARPAEGHLSEEDWERLACHELAPEEREAALDHVIRCAACARTYRAIGALGAEARSFDPGAPRERVRVLAFPRWPVLLGLAAAAVLTLVLLRPASGPGLAPAPKSDVFRGDTDILDPAPLVPQGRVVGLPAELRWRGISVPADYRVTILDGEGEVVWTSPVLDATTLAWPAELTLKPGSYFWQVSALPRSGLPGDRRASPLGTFELVSASRP